MKILNKVVIGMASLVLLTACGPSKVSYDKYHEKALEAAKKENGFTKVEVNGKAKYAQEGEGTKKVVEYEFDKVTVEGFTNGRMSVADYTVKASALFLAGKEVELAALSLAMSTAEAVVKSDDTVYYEDLSAEAKKDGEKQSIKFDENGLVKSIKFSGDASGSLTFSWSK